MLHVGMNIADKARLFREVRRVLRPGARFGTYAVLQGPGGAPLCPVPWATGPQTSFLVTADAFQALLRGAAFQVLALVARTDFARDLMLAARRRPVPQQPAAQSAPPRGLHTRWARARRGKAGKRD